MKSQKSIYIKSRKIIDFSNFPKQEKKVEPVYFDPKYPMAKFGSLSLFTNTPLQFSICNKKKKESNKEEKQMMKMLENNQNSLSVLLQPSKTAFERQVASKVFSSNLFNSIYGEQADQIERKQIQQLTFKQPFKMINIQALEFLLQSTTKQKTGLKRRKVQKKKSIFRASNQEVTTNKSVKIVLDKERRTRIINEVKSYFSEFRNVQVPTVCEQFLNLKELYEEDLLLKQNKIYSPNTYMTQPSKYLKRKQSSDQNYKKKLQWSEESLILNNIPEFKHQTLLFMIDKANFQLLKTISFKYLRITDEAVVLFLDCFHRISSFKKNLQKLQITNISIQSISKFCEKIKQILKKTLISTLILDHMDIGNKQFETICLGLSKNQAIEQISMKNNRISFIMVKSMQSLMKNCPKIKKIDLRFNEITDKEQNIRKWKKHYDQKFLF